jgi:hypothetical protein
MYQPFILFGSVGRMNSSMGVPKHHLVDLTTYFLRDRSVSRVDYCVEKIRMTYPTVIHTSHSHQADSATAPPAVTSLSLCQPGNDRLHSVQW